MTEQTAVRRSHRRVRPRRCSPATFALTDDELVHEAPAILGRHTPSTLAHADAVRDESTRAQQHLKEFR
jgi:hypothetical protein